MNQFSIKLDLVYVDYDNRAINTVRVGTGNNRTFALATF